MAVDFYLDLGTEYAGESEDSKHVGKIKIYSFSWGGAQHTTVSGTGGSGAGKVSLSDFNIMKTLDKATPKLFAAMTKGNHIVKGTLYAIKAGGNNEPYLTVEFDEMFITSLQESASSEDPMESVSFSYNKVTLTYSTQDTTGALTPAGTWIYDLQKNVTS